MEFGQNAPHAITPKQNLQFTFQDGLNHDRRAVKEREHAAQGQQNRKHLACRRQRPHFAVADRSQRDHRHVQAVEQGPAFDDSVASGTRCQQRRWHGEKCNQPARELPAQDRNIGLGC